jgi:iron complex outermembrane recepter protein
MQKMKSSLVGPTRVMPRFWQTYSVLFAIAALPSTARPAGVSPSVDPDTSLQEIVVTAEKRSESALRTPIALSTYTGDNLQEQQVISIASLQNLDPSVNFSKSAFGGWPFVVIRGVSTSDGTSGSTPGISFNVDGIPLNRGFEQTTAFLDVERIEVLKGPQGTLYGQSSTGGTLNVITNKPQNELQASADVTVGNYNTRRTTAMVNLPIAGWLAVRAAVNSNKHDGYIVPSDGSTPTSDADDWTSRVSLLGSFTDDVSLLLTVTNGHLGGAGGGSVNWDTLQSNPTGSRQRVVYGGNPFPSYDDDTFSNFAAQFNWTLGPVQLTYVGGYLNYTANEQQASTNNPLGNTPPPCPCFVAGPPAYTWLHQGSHTLTDSHELRLANSAPGFADWVVGVNWYHEHIHDDNHLWYTPYAPGTAPTVTDSVNFFDFLSNTIRTSKAAFGQTTLHLSEQWDVTAGLRYTLDSLESPGTQAFAPYSFTTFSPWPDTLGNPCVAPAACIGDPSGGSQRDHKITYRVGAAYHFTGSQMLFANVATGFKPGGFTNLDPTTGQPGPYKAEQLTAYEVGYKGRPASNLEINSDLFYYNYSERLITGGVIPPGGGRPVIGLTTAPARIYGWESDLTYRPTHADEVKLSAALLKAYYSKDLLEVDAAGVTQNLRGKALDTTPKFAATLAYDHEWTLSGGATFRAGLQTKYSSSYEETDVQNAVQYKQRQFTRSNADIRFTDATGKFYVGAFVQNIENRLQINANPSGFVNAPGFVPQPGPNGSLVPDAATVTVTDPRTWGFTAGVKF